MEWYFRNEVPVEMLNKWNKFVCDLSSVGVISLPRCLYEKSTDKINKCYLHGFADASKKAYCAMIYLVYETDTGMHSGLICAKTRVAPLKELSIPRLELMSGRILSTLMETVYNALSPQIKIDGCRYWLDSKTALYWINNQGEWRQFVQHRVNEILKISKKEDWGHCIGVCNPADLGSRRVSATILRDSRLWWEGPHWLSMGKEYWPKSFTLEDSPEIMEEKRKTVNVTAVIEQNKLSVTEIIEVDKFSSLKRLLRIRFVTNLRSAREGKILKLGELDSEEVSRAERIWIKGSQIDLKKQPGYNEIALKLGLFEEDGILKCKGRLENSDLALETKFPIILPNNNWFTRLVIEDCHERVMHEGLKATLTEYRSSFWTTKGRQYVKKILRDCRKCKKVQGKSYGVPSVAPLPEFRVKEVPPFTYIGIDFAGPLFYKSKIGKMEKCYIALYTCATSRAIHLDLVEDMSGPTFIRSLRRFTSRRGTPSLINSDNAKTFKFTNKFLDKLGNSREVSSYLVEKKITWRFNLERSPWWGGYFEKLVGSVKRCLRKVLGNAKLTFDELHTVLLEVEATLNSRPLTYIYDEVEVYPLTPFHLMYGHRLSQLADDLDINDLELEESSSAYSKRFCYLIKKLSHFAGRWRREYLTELREFHRNNRNGEIIVSVGDIVLVQEEHVKRNSWKMGKIVELVQGKDGVVRGAKVKVCGSGKSEILSRPLQKLFPFELARMNEIAGKSTDIERKENEVREQNACEFSPIVICPNRVVEPQRRKSKRAAGQDSQWKTRLMLDS
ncbi:uncharacterized protein LOC135687848 [Rhopilema esculentum]|uniref:uncharacterized protein LOC135687848 n=1 Tax=Rhopilema esculentum TaxID=499914 RepID=UPI0031D2EDC5